MKKFSRNVIFYFVIMEENTEDHLGLRRLIHSAAPQAIIESIYEFGEAVNYFRETKTIPHVLFISEEMSKAGLTIAADGGITNYTFESLPFVMLSTKNYLLNGHLNYSKPYDASDLVSIVGSMNKQWLA